MTVDRPGVRRRSACAALLWTVVLAASPSAFADAVSTDIHGLWRVDQARTEPLLDRGTARVDFGSDGRLSGHTSCAAMSGRYELDGDRIHIGPITTAPAAGAPACRRLQLEQEDRILTALELAVTARVRPDDGLLEIRDAEGRGLLRGTRFGSDDDDPK